LPSPTKKAPGRSSRPPGGGTARRGATNGRGADESATGSNGAGSAAENGSREGAKRSVVGGKRLSKRSGMTKGDVRRHQRERLLAAMIKVAGTDGVANATVAVVIAEAEVSRATFYALFDDRLDCLLAAFEWAFDAQISEVQKGCAQGDSWADRLRSGLTGLLERLAADPAQARVLVLEMLVLGPRARQRYREELGRFVPFFEEGRALFSAGGVSAEFVPAIVLMLAMRIGDEVAAGRAQGLPGLVDGMVRDVIVILGGEATEVEGPKAAGSSLGAAV
jgi:AcrR family transcriptional regulator